MSRPLVVWRLVDGKRGHERQSEGLVRALAARSALECHDVAVDGRRGAGLLDALLRRCAAGAGLPDPDLAIGAGRATHWPLVAARRARGARSVVLMRPGLPWHWFDLCVVPRHDRPPRRANVEVSEGPLNPLAPAATKDPARGVILLGGPSAHHAFDVAAVVAQVAGIVAAAPRIAWQISDSRRSPPALRAALAGEPALAGCFVPFETCAPDWLPRTLATASQAWVSADSVAMIYEALTAGAAVGIVELPARRADRVSAIVPALVARGWVARPGGPVTAPVTLDEAGRIAAAILARWPDLVRPA